MKLGRASLITYLLAATAIAGGCKKQVSVSVDQAPAAGSAVAAMPAAPAAKDPWAASAAPVKKDPLPHPLLWKAEKDGKTSYLLGTIHEGVDPEVRLPDVVWKDSDSEPAFAMETDLDSVDLDSLKRTDHGSIHADLGPDYWQKFQAVVTPAVAKSIDTQKVSIAASMMSMRDMPQTPPMDPYLLAKAQLAKKQVVYLEPAAKQLALLDKWMDVRALKQMIDTAATTKAEMADLLNAYIAGDEARMLKLSDGEREDFVKSGRTSAEYDQQMDEMLYARNASWIAGIEKMHAAGGGFIAVGAMHLIGPKSVLDLLAKDGFTVTRVASAAP